MTHPQERTPSLIIPLLICAACAAPGVILKLASIHAPAGVEAACFGGTILASAFVLTWASEAAQKDVPRAFAVVILSLIAVLPEYAVDVVIAYKAAHDPAQRGLAIANMTGANRLLVGLAWPLVWFLTAWKIRRPKIRTPRELGLEVTMLVISSLIVSAMAFTGHLTILHGCILALVFLFYAFLSIRAGAEEAHGVGPALALMEMPTAKRRTSVILLLLSAAGAILIVAEPFKDALEHTSRALGISEYVVIQWIAPLASEAPEVVVAILLVLEKRSTEALAVLVASKVNQFTLLVGCIPFAYGIARGDGAPLELDHHQVAEIGVTGAQTLFAAATVANRTLGKKGGLSLFTLFLLQLGVSGFLEFKYDGVDKDHYETMSRWSFAALYATCAVGLAIHQRRDVVRMLKVTKERIIAAFTFGSAAKN